MAADGNSSGLCFGKQPCHRPRNPAVGADHFPGSHLGSVPEGHALVPGLLFSHPIVVVAGPGWAMGRTAKGISALIPSSHRRPLSTSRKPRDRAHSSLVAGQVWKESETQRLRSMWKSTSCVTTADASWSTGQRGEKH